MLDHSLPCATFQCINVFPKVPDQSEVESVEASVISSQQGIRIPSFSRTKHHDTSYQSVSALEGLTALKVYLEGLQGWDRMSSCHLASQQTSVVTKHAGSVQCL